MNVLSVGRGVCSKSWRRLSCVGFASWWTWHLQWIRQVEYECLEMGVFVECYKCLWCSRLLVLQERNSILKQLGCVFGYLKSCPLDNLVSLHLASCAQELAAVCAQHGALSWKVRPFLLLLLDAVAYCMLGVRTDWKA